MYGAFQLVDHEDRDVFAFVRSGVTISQLAVIVLNFHLYEVSWNSPSKAISGFGCGIVKLPWANWIQAGRVGVDLAGPDAAFICLI
jgi:hypothetical protein